MRDHKQHSRGRPPVDRLKPFAESAMSAQPASDPLPDVLPFPKLFSPTAPPDPRITNPGVTHSRQNSRSRSQAATGQETLWATELDPEIKALAQAAEQTFRDPIVPEESRQWMRENLTVRNFYEDWMERDRKQRVASKKKLSLGSLSKDRQALNRWERFSRPDDWQEDREWPGFPIGAITDRYLTHVFDKMKVELSDSTARSTWFHLRTMFNYAVKVRALDHAPKPTFGDVIDEDVEIYTPEQIAAAYHSLRDYPDLQVAFVLGLNVGARTVDTFCLEWDKIDLSGDRPTLRFQSKKTGKRQCIPLAEITAKHLLRLPSRGTDRLVFPGRSNPEAVDPERSNPAKRRRQILSVLFHQVRIDYEKPFQVARATCNTRLNSTPGYYGSGHFFMGHALGLNSTSYMEPSELMFAAANAVPQPPCFLDF